MNHPQRSKAFRRKFKRRYTRQQREHKLSRRLLQSLGDAWFSLWPSSFYWEDLDAIKESIYEEIEHDALEGTTI